MGVTLKKTRIKKPMNAFFLYRRQMRDYIRSTYNITKSQDVSKIAGKSWACEPESVKQKYHKIAMIDYLQREENMYLAPKSINTETRLSLDTAIKTSNFGVDMSSSLASPPSSTDMSFAYFIDAGNQCGVSQDVQKACSLNS
ncbi:hypothetical protein BC833DRAFT_591636 [Globomyces pollinis-pini]|nr:hypothetical protein BC833DRAFT_591636 [Globomyces pollinis-pini]